MPGMSLAGENLKIPQSDLVLAPDLQDRWLARDKARHLLASFMLTGAMMYRLRFYEGWDTFSSRITGAGVTFGLGVVKELRDRSTSAPCNRFSWKDLVADLAGVCLGILLLEWR